MAKRSIEEILREYQTTAPQSIDYGGSDVSPAGGMETRSMSPIQSPQTDTSTFTPEVQNLYNFMQKSSNSPEALATQSEQLHQKILDAARNGQDTSELIAAYQTLNKIPKTTPSLFNLPGRVVGGIKDLVVGAKDLAVGSVKGLTGMGQGLYGMATGNQQALQEGTALRKEGLKQARGPSEAIIGGAQDIARNVYKGTVGTAAAVAGAFGSPIQQNIEDSKLLHAIFGEGNLTPNSVKDYIATSGENALNLLLMGKGKTIKQFAEQSLKRTALEGGAINAGYNLTADIRRPTQEGETLWDRVRNSLGNMIGGFLTGAPTAVLTQIASKGLFRNKKPPEEPGLTPTELKQRAEAMTPPPPEEPPPPPGTPLKAPSKWDTQKQVEEIAPSKPVDVTGSVKRGEQAVKNLAKDISKTYEEDSARIAANNAGRDLRAAHDEIIKKTDDYLNSVGIERVKRGTGFTYLDRSAKLTPYEVSKLGMAVDQMRNFAGKDMDAIGMNRMRQGLSNYFGQGGEQYQQMLTKIYEDIVKDTLAKHIPELSWLNTNHRAGADLVSRASKVVKEKHFLNMFESGGITVQNIMKELESALGIEGSIVAPAKRKIQEGAALEATRKDLTQAIEQHGEAKVKILTDTQNRLKKFMKGRAATAQKEFEDAVKINLEKLKASGMAAEESKFNKMLRSKAIQFIVKKLTPL